MPGSTTQANEGVASFVAAPAEIDENYVAPKPMSIEEMDKNKTRPSSFVIGIGGNLIQDGRTYAMRGRIRLFIAFFDTVILKSGCGGHHDHYLSKICSC